MSFDRRELLKYFGIGATIAPFVDGKPLVQAAAQVIKEPEVRPVEIVDKFPDGHVPSHFQQRLEWNPYEAIWLKMWQIENSPTYHSTPILEHILQREPADAEKAAVAGVIQWFGTNCGAAWVYEVHRALGANIEWNWNPERSHRIQALQHHNVWCDVTPVFPTWPNPGVRPEALQISYRGYQINLIPKEGKQ